LLLVGCGRIGFDSRTGDAGTGDDGTPAAAFLAGYDRRKEIRIAPLIDTDVADVPINVTMEEATDLAASARADGTDFVVTAADGVTVIGHEVVSWTPSPGKLDMWIRIPTLSGSATTVAYLYYGGAQQTPSGAWPPLYRGVWHMNSAGGIWNDSASDNDAVQNNAAARPTDDGGIAGNAARLDGIDDSIEVPDQPNGLLDFGTTSFAYSLWVNVTQTENEFDVVMTKGAFDPNQPGYDMELGANDWEALLADGTTGFGARFGTASQFVGQGWFQLLAVVDRGAGELRAYVNGQFTANDDISTMGSVDNDLPLQFGRDVDFYRGLLDEVRIYKDIPELERLAIERANFKERDRIVVLPEEQR
jgi:hypothetical protein